MKLIRKSSKLILLQTRQSFDWPDCCLSCGRETTDLVERQPEDQRNPLLQAAAAVTPAAALLTLPSQKSNPALMLPVCVTCQKLPPGLRKLFWGMLLLAVVLFAASMVYITNYPTADGPFYWLMLLLAGILFIAAIAIYTGHKNKVLPMRVLRVKKGYEYHVTGGYVFRWAHQTLRERKTMELPEE